MNPLFLCLNTAKGKTGQFPPWMVEKIQAMGNLSAHQQSEMIMMCY